MQGSNAVSNQPELICEASILGGSPPLITHQSRPVGYLHLFCSLHTETDAHWQFKWLTRSLSQGEAITDGTPSAAPQVGKCPDESERFPNKSWRLCSRTDPMWRFIPWNVGRNHSLHIKQPVKWKTRYRGQICWGGSGGVLKFLYSCCGDRRGCVPWLWASVDSFTNAVLRFNCCLG